jgi:hypothetical protein
METENIQFKMKNTMRQHEADRVIFQALDAIHKAIHWEHCFYRPTILRSFFKKINAVQAHHWRVQIMSAYKRLHRGTVPSQQSVEFLVERTGFFRFPEEPFYSVGLFQAMPTTSERRKLQQLPARASYS